MDYTKHLCLSEFEEAGLARVDQQTRGYWTGGADDLITVKENIEAYNKYRLRPFFMRNVSVIDASPTKTLFGKNFAIPCGIAPAAWQCLATPDGEVATAQAAKARNWPMGLSSYSNKGMDEVKMAGGDNAAVFQLYIFQNRSVTEDIVRRAEKAGYSALALTIDTPYLGFRRNETRNVFTVPSHLRAGNLPGGLEGTVDLQAQRDQSVSVSSSSNANVVNPNLTWQYDIPWLRRITKMKIFVKGVLTPEDAELAVKAGVDGIWVSNHGGRQLDGCITTLDALPDIVDAVAGRVPVHMDGGIRRGTDIFKALALGADFVWIGRPLFWGLSLGGRQGLEHLLTLLENEFRLTMALTGCQKVSEISRKHLARIGPKLERL